MNLKLPLYLHFIHCSINFFFLARDTILEVNLTKLFIVYHACMLDQ